MSRLLQPSMIGVASKPATVPERVISFLSRMGARIHVQLRKGKPILFPYGATVEKTERELIIKDPRGEEIGWFDRSEIAGYWKENIPLNIADVKDELLEQLTDGPRTEESADSGTQ